MEQPRQHSILPSGKQVVLRMQVWPLGEGIGLMKLWDLAAYIDSVTQETSALSLAEPNRDSHLGDR